MKNRFFILNLMGLTGFIFLSSSCTTKLNATKELGLITRDKSSIRLSDSFTIHTSEFQSDKEARQYAMERRLLILRKFETMIEPYFGTVNAKKCSENLKSDILESRDDSFVAVIQVLTKGPERLLHDCLEENNTDRVQIEFLVCGKKFYDIRTYSSLKDPELPYQQNYFCKAKK